MALKKSESPPKPSVLHAINAVGLVKDKLGPDYCAFIVQPNTVLTLADARGFADSVFYHPKPEVLKVWRKAQKDVLSLLGETRDLIFTLTTSKNPSGENYSSSDLINRVGLAYSFNHYSFLSKTDNAVLLKAATPQKVVEAFKTLLRKKPIFTKYNRDQIMHIASGVCLGYPEKAILSTLDSYLIEPNEFTPREVEANILGAAYYSCPQPVYSYPRHLITDKDIVDHEKLWSQILMDFYKSDLHQQLAKNKHFQKQIRDLSRY